MFRIQTKSSNGTLHFGRSEELYMRTYKNNENPFGLVEPLHSTITIIHCHQIPANGNNISVGS